MLRRMGSARSRESWPKQMLLDPKPRLLPGQIATQGEASHLPMCQRGRLDLSAPAALRTSPRPTGQLEPWAQKTLSVSPGTACLSSLCMAQKGRPPWRLQKQKPVHTHLLPTSASLLMVCGPPRGKEPLNQTSLNPDHFAHWTLAGPLPLPRLLRDLWQERQRSEAPHTLLRE